MKKVNVLAAASAVVLGLAATSCDSKQNVSLSNDVDSVSYAIGVSTGAGSEYTVCGIVKGCY